MKALQSVRVQTLPKRLHTTSVPRPCTAALRLVLETTVVSLATAPIAHHPPGTQALFNLGALALEGAGGVTRLTSNSKGSSGGGDGSAVAVPEAATAAGLPDEDLAEAYFEAAARVSAGRRFTGLPVDLMRPEGRAGDEEQQEREAMLAPTEAEAWAWLPARMTLAAVRGRNAVASWWRGEAKEGAGGSVAGTVEAGGAPWWESISRDSWVMVAVLCVLVLLGCAWCTAS